MVKGLEPWALHKSERASLNEACLGGRPPHVFSGGLFFAVELSKVAVSVDFASCSYLPINQMQSLLSVFLTFKCRFS